MCQPGRPSPQGELQRVSSSALAAFQSAKSCGARLSAAASSPSPCRISSGGRFESLPYSGKLSTLKYTSPPAS